MPNVLLVDDNPNNLDLLTIRLQADYKDCRILTATNGSDAINVARSNPLDCILMDVMMPGIDGKEACRQIKLEPRLRHIPVILITAMKTDVDSRVEGVEAGADEYVTKPINFKELLAKMSAHIRVKHLHDELQAAHDKLRDMDRYKSSFIEKMSRDLEGPIHGLSEQLTILRSAGPLNEPQTKSWEIAEANTHLLQQLVSQMLEVVRLEQNLVSGHPETLDLSLLLAEITQEDLPLVEQKQISFVLETTPGLVVRADRKMCREMLLNLARVAVYFSEADEDVSAFCRRENKEIVGGFRLINAELSGQGLDDQLFEKFAQLRLKEEMMAQLNLELPLAKLLAQAVKGRVWVLSSQKEESVSIGFAIPAGE